MTLHRGLLSGAMAAILLMVVVFGGGQWLSSNFAETSQSAGVGTEQLNAWLSRALAVAIDETGRGADPKDWEPYQVEVCGPRAIAFFVERDPAGVRPYRWAIGEPATVPGVQAVGITGTLLDVDVASVRATMPACSAVLDRSLQDEPARDALAEARAAWDAAAAGENPLSVVPIPNPRELRGVRVLEMSPLTRDMYSVLLGSEDGIETKFDRIKLSVSADGAFELDSAASDAAVAQDLVVYRDASTGVPTYFGTIEDPQVAAVEIIGRNLHLRYSVESPGFIIEADVQSRELHSFQFIGVDSSVVASGEIVAWPPER